MGESVMFPLIRAFVSSAHLSRFSLDGEDVTKADVLAELDATQEALTVAYSLLDGEGYFSDPDYPEAQKIAALVGR